MNRQTFCNKLKQARNEANIKQDLVAEKLNITKSAVSDIEAGKRKVDALELKTLADLYSKKIGWFFDESEKPTFEYRNDRLAQEAFELLEKAPKKIQSATFCAVIGFLKEWNISQ